MTVAVVMGSDSDLAVMAPAIEMLERFDVPHVAHCVSAHRDPLGMVEFATSARASGIRIIIAGAGGAAHLPGMIASMTELPVIGVPVGRPGLEGMDALLSVVQMPTGVPVATMAIDGAANAALHAIRILALGDERLTNALAEHFATMRAAVAEKDGTIRKRSAP